MCVCHVAQRLRQKCNTANTTDMAPVTEEAYIKRLEIFLNAETNVRGESHLGLKRRQAATANPPHAATDQPKRHQQLEYAGPKQCLFDETVSEDVDSNVKYMQTKYSLFIPNAEYLINLEGLITYLGAKVYKSRQCLFCDRHFASAEAVVMHMVSKGHTLIGTESEEMRAELEDFYDFRPSYKQLAEKLKGQQKINALENKQSQDEEQPPQDEAEQTSGREEDEDEWEYFDDDTTDLPADAKLGQLLTKFGCTRTHVTDVGDLQLPDGRSVGNRNLAYVYKQRLRPLEVQAAHRAALKNEEEVTPVISGTEKVAMLKCHRRFLRNQMRLGIKQNALQKYVKKREMCF
eukprot:GHVS01050887.1.p1 GENE.GHVS01050887.1~~GHVS01050887.1.p1  ORF type:complete len:347 (-),score=67.98 GHVS01050887.1:34-1074(-)